MNLSPIFSGAGHFKLGQPGLAIVFMLFESAGWIAFATWAALSTSSPLAAGIILLATGCVRLLSLVHARRLGRATDGLAGGIFFLVAAFGGELVLVLMLLRATLMPIYKVPSSSMEPTLLGDSFMSHGADCPYRELHVDPAGDRIVTSRLPLLVAPIPRFDVVVFQFPLNTSRNFVSRVAGLPGEELVIRDGDLFARAKGEAKFRVLRKPQEVLWIRTPGSADPLRDAGRFVGLWEKVGGAFRMEDGILRTDGTRGGGFELGSSRRFTDGGYQEVGDLRIAFRFQVSQGEVFAKVKNGFGEFVARLSSDGSGSLSNGGTRFPLKGPRLGPGTWHSLDLSVRDGLAVLGADGTPVAALEYVTFLEDAGRRKDDSGALGFGARGDGVLIRDLEQFQDVCYRAKPAGDWDEGRPLAIPEGSYVLLGDNVYSSHDARSWKRSTFRLKDGRTIECEAQQVDNFSEVRPDPGREGHRLVAADRDGRVVWFDPKEVVSETSEPFRFVERRYIFGKVMRIWWPPQRAGPVR